MAKGTKTRRTMLREIMAEVADEVIQQKMPKSVNPDRKKAVDHLDDMLHLHMLLAEQIQRRHLAENEDQFEKAAGPLAQDQHFRYCMEQAKDCAAKLAPYQSPTFRAIVVAPADQNAGEMRKRFTLTIFDDSKAIEAKATHPAPAEEQ